MIDIKVYICFITLSVVGYFAENQVLFIDMTNLSQVCFCFTAVSLFACVVFLM